MVPIISCGSSTIVFMGCRISARRAELRALARTDYSEFVAMPQQNLLPIPENVSDEEACVLEPVALALRAFDLLMPKIGEWSTILGQGSIGLLMTQVAKLRG